VKERMSDQVIILNTCPRCEYAGFERLKTHSYCVNCGYSPEFQESEINEGNWQWVFKHIERASVFNLDKSSRKRHPAPAMFEQKDSVVRASL